LVADRNSVNGTLLAQVTTGALTTPAALKAAYRRLSMAVHPDHGAPSGEAFLALQADYEASRRALEDRRSATAATLGHPGFLDTFFELVSLGLLDDRRRRWQGRAVATRLQRVTDLFDRRSGGHPGDFVRALGELDEGPHQLILAMLSYRYNPWKHARVQVQRRLDEVRGALATTGRIHGLALIDALAAELLGASTRGTR